MARRLDQHERQGGDECHVLTPHPRDPLYIHTLSPSRNKNINSSRKWWLRGKKKMLESVVSWLTPTVLFLLLNLVIGTIAFTSYLSSSAAEPSVATKLFRSTSPSFILDRFKSFNLYSSSSSSSDDPTSTEILKSEQCKPEPEPEPEPESVTKPEPEPEQEHPIVRSQSDTQPAAGDMRKKVPKKLEKSATLNHFDFHDPEQESSPLKRPATMREREREKEQKEEDAEDDAKADDFINRFRQQLKLQRMDSIIRYKEMLNRGNQE